ncbi:hypothetical protein PS619_04702 [Pseudomonas fluorescens]|nr:hypothetical protein PS619_04702 [Pseudomonas fluorescens]
MKMSSLQVSTPEGNSGRLFSDTEDFTFRYHEDASPQMAISLLMPVRHDEFRRRELHPVFQPRGGLLNSNKRKSVAKRCYLPIQAYASIPTQSSHSRQLYVRHPIHVASPQTIQHPLGTDEQPVPDSLPQLSGQ